MLVKRFIIVQGQTLGPNVSAVAIFLGAFSEVIQYSIELFVFIGPALLHTHPGTRKIYRQQIPLESQ